MAIDLETTIPASRRALLAASFGAAAATIASALGRPAPVRAASGSFESSDATPAVSATTTSTSGRGVLAFANASSGTTYGIYGESASSGGIGVYGYASASSGVTDGVNGYSLSTSGIGVRGSAGASSGVTYGVFGLSQSTTGYGVVGHASASAGATHGVFGRSDSTSGRGIYGFAAGASGTTYGAVGRSDSTSGIGAQGWATAGTGTTRGVLGRVDSPDGTAVQGYSGTSTPPAPSPKTAIYGYAAQDAASRGVYGRSVAGRGVYGQSQTGQGVRGYSATGAAGYFSTSGLKKGAALRAVGRVRLDNCAGVATILSGSALSTAISPGIDLTSTSAVVATLMGNAGGSTTVKRVVVDTAADTFTIVLTAAASANVRVAWHVFG